jgi:citrate synthase
MLIKISINMGRKTKAAAPAGTPAKSDYLGRDAALQILDVKPQTLYCYVSRGQVRSIRHPDGRASLYLREDIERMSARAATRRRSRQGYSPAVGTRVIWPRSITTTADDGHWYRSRSALSLVNERCTFESVSEYLWTGEWVDEPVGWTVDAIPSQFVSLLESAASLHQRPHLIHLLAHAVLALGIAEGSRSDRFRAGGAPVISARRILRTMAGVFGLASSKRTFLKLENGELVCEGIARALGMRRSPETLQALDALLVLMADYDLDPPALAARLAASAGGDVHAGVNAALSVYSASLTGRVCDRVEQIFPVHAHPEALLSKVRTMLDAGRTVPGLERGGSRYPQGDPRARCLIKLACTASRDLPAFRRMAEAIEMIEKECGATPSVECGLVLMSRAIGLPERTASGLYAISRTAGWIAHVFDQRLAGFMVWPRMQVAAAGT